MNDLTEWPVPYCETWRHPARVPDQLSKAADSRLLTRVWSGVAWQGLYIVNAAFCPHIFCKYVLAALSSIQSGIMTHWHKGWQKPIAFLEWESRSWIKRSEQAKLANSKQWDKIAVSIIRISGLLKPFKHWLTQLAHLQNEKLQQCECICEDLKSLPRRPARTPSWWPETPSSWKSSGVWPLWPALYCLATVEMGEEAIPWWVGGQSSTVTSGLW